MGCCPPGRYIYVYNIYIYIYVCVYIYYVYSETESERETCVVEGGVALEAADVAVSIVFEEESHKVRMPPSRRVVQRRPVCESE